MTVAALHPFSGVVRGAVAAALASAERILRVLITILCGGDDWAVCDARRGDDRRAPGGHCRWCAGSWAPAVGKMLATAASSEIAATVTRMAVPLARGGRGWATRAERRAAVAVPVAAAAVVAATSTRVAAAAPLVCCVAAVSAPWAAVVAAVAVVVCLPAVVRAAGECLVAALRAATAAAWRPPSPLTPSPIASLHEDAVPRRPHGRSAAVAVPRRRWSSQLWGCQVAAGTALRPPRPLLQPPCGPLSRLPFHAVGAHGGRLRSGIGGDSGDCRGAPLPVDSLADCAHC